MRVVTWNVYWLGDEDRAPRDPDDEARLAEAFARLDADLICVQEVVDPPLLERIAAAAGALAGRRWTSRRAGRFLGGSGQRQKVGFVYDPDRVEVLAAALLRGGPTRRPFAVHVRQDGLELTAVGLHLQAGWPDFHDPDDAARRAEQGDALRGWLAGEAREANPALPAPPTDAVLLLGDYNALHDSESLAPLRRPPLEDWSWPLPEAPPGLPAVSSVEDGVLIDFIQLSPAAAARVEDGPRIVPVDRDLQAPDLRRFSDHRPVLVELL